MSHIVARTDDVYMCLTLLPERMKCTCLSYVLPGLIYMPVQTKCTYVSNPCAGIDKMYLSV